MTDEYFQSIHRKDFKLFSLLPSKNFIHEQTRKLILPNLERFRAIEESNEHDVESYLLWAEKQGRGHRDNIHSSPQLFSPPRLLLSLLLILIHSTPFRIQKMLPQN